jgi:hypothetical protein
MIRHSAGFLAALLLGALGCHHGTSPDDCPDSAPTINGSASQPDLSLVPSCEARNRTSD